MLTWTEDRHNEYKKTGKVSTLVNQFIVIAPGGPSEYQGSLSSALRKAGNYPIQNASSSVVGCVLYEICQYINSSSSIQYYQSMIQMIKNVCELNELRGCRQLKNTILSFVITY